MVGAAHEQVPWEEGERDEDLYASYQIGTPSHYVVVSTVIRWIFPCLPLPEQGIAGVLTSWQNPDSVSDCDRYTEQSQITELGRITS